jgi:predicted small integral membrane protein
MLAVRWMKIAMVASVALFALVVAYDNVVDYGSNWEFVRHTLSMDTTFANSVLRNRAITDPKLWAVAYWLIIATEAITGALLAYGAYVLARAHRAPAERFNAAKTWALLGAGLGFLLWFTGFTVVAGEWFAMWQSTSWNGLASASRFYLALLGVMIFLNQPDGEVDRA